ncbi:unnamed protein product [Closterium sp. NIES-65]|nr:unnamed protein product [Closterium sp. NIES-65]
MCLSASSSLCVLLSLRPPLSASSSLCVLLSLRPPLSASSSLCVLLSPCSIFSLLQMSAFYLGSSPSPASSPSPTPPPLPSSESTHTFPPFLLPFSSLSPPFLLPFSSLSPPVLLPFSSLSPPFLLPFSSLSPPFLLPFSSLSPPVLLPFSSRSPPVLLPFSSRSPPVLLPFSSLSMSPPSLPHQIPPIPLPPPSLFLHWTPVSATQVDMAIEAKAAGRAKDGWIALGWSPKGKMSPADAVIGNLAGGLNTGVVMLALPRSSTPSPAHSSPTPPQPSPNSFSRTKNTGVVMRFPMAGLSKLVWAFSRPGLPSLSFHGNS